MIKKYLYIVFGLTCVGLGYIGIILPGLPTTPFLLLAIWFFSRSSKQFENWLVNHKIFGPFIIDWKKYKGIRKKNKIYAIILIIITFSFSIYYTFSFYIDITLSIGGIILSIYIMTRPTPPKL